MLSKTKTLLGAALTLLAGTLISAAPAAAQEPTTVTGCLSKGPSEGTFTLTQDDRKTFALTSTTVKLNDHVGHKITVVGTPAGIDKAVETGAVSAKDTGMAREPAAAADTGMQHAGKPHETGMQKDTVMQRMGHPGGALNVSKMTMVAAECK